ncbi:MAG: glycosyltransferase family 39 protein [Fimbriimonadaceae bacterium]|nr:glycosyltransferase family 39 protein [Fimbriimonadaceae bacterium]QYK55345.1 MAG: glycosyltransferase family 39 protein [Fimbriimonadaceae bacterium]
MVVAVLYLAVCVAIMSVTPYRTGGLLRYQRGPDGFPARIADIGAPDERQHANYIRVLLDGKPFPVLKPGDPDLYESYQAHQPPLYYLVAAGWCRALGLDPTAPSAGGGVRTLNVLVGLLTLAGLAAGVRWAGGSAAMQASAAVAMLVPMVAALHAAVGNDPLLYALLTWSVALAVKGCVHGWPLKLGILIGVLGGLALLTKTTALALFPVLAVAIALAWRSGQRQPAGWAAALALPALIASPWMVRNTQLYGDPFALKAFNEAFVGSPQASLFIEGLGPLTYWTQMVGWWTWRSIVGAFGYMDIFILETAGPNASGAFYNLAGLLAAATVGVGVWSLASRENKAEGGRVLLVLGATLMAVVALLFVRFNLQYFQAQARYLYPAIAGFAWIGAAGAARMAGDRRELAWVVPALFWLLVDGLAWSAMATGFPIRAEP